MQVETGEIKTTPLTDEQKKSGRYIQLTPLQAEALGALPTDEIRVRVYKAWREYKTIKKFNNNFERIKAEEAFYVGVITGVELKG